MKGNFKTSEIGAFQNLYREKLNRHDTGGDLIIKNNPKLKQKFLCLPQKSFSFVKSIFCTSSSYKQIYMYARIKW